jgi:hypothetical protein
MNAWPRDFRARASNDIVSKDIETQRSDDGLLVLT